MNESGNVNFKKFVRVMGNVIWFVGTGFEMGLVFFLLGALLCMTVVGIPFGKQCFKIGLLVFFPSGKSVNVNFKEHAVANALWILFGGFVISICFAFLGVIWFITILGFFKGKKCFKFAKLALMPFGAEINDCDEASSQNLPMLF